MFTLLDLGAGFFVGILLGLIFMFGRSVYEAVSLWILEKKAESIDVTSVGVLEPAMSVDASGSDDLEEREKAWKIINDGINRARQWSYHYVNVSYDVYKAIPYKTLVKTLKSAGYKPRDIINGRFQESDYIRQGFLRIVWK